MDLHQRRSLLKTQTNPNRAMDYIITLKAVSTKGARLCLRYIPDKVVLSQDCFGPYVSALFDQEGLLLEEGATCLMDDINNQLVARWVQVTAEIEQDNTTSHSLVLEDRQPQWDNPHLLARMRLI